MESRTNTSIVRLVGIYRADGGLVGELRYLARHYLRHEECSLCSVTHGTFRRRAAWDDAVAALGVPFDLLHRNELDGDLQRFADNAACIVAIHADGSRDVLLTDAQIGEADGDVDRLFALLRERVANPDRR